MANSVTGRIKYVDQFNADVALAEHGVPFIIQKIILVTAAAGDIFRLEDVEGNRLFHMTNNGGNARHTEIDFGDEGFNFGGQGVVIDVSDCTGIDGTDGSDAVFIYLK